ncbi:Flagellar cap protein [Anaerohalosphaera lusitana]|uniref:Flagellar hook-associated protein 2 n=1 Tax=Anaerohalosphaera lusitana TaxID=1936003 RepID=A0A1U9NH33_9BACT|nr:flagellar filament capping protein FliD [Anaerohalosphaera lusitana]AQT66910.1 Flagellar cap protein [Anaerohalosphaera lusitana]
MELSGLSSGLDTQSIVQQLMASMQGRLYNYKYQKQEWEQKDAALGELEAKLNSFESAAGKLVGADNLRGYNSTSSDSDVLSVSVDSSKVFEGSHTIAVKQLATTESWVHDTGFRFQDSLVGAGKFIYSYNHEERVIETNDETTLEDLVGLINNDPENPGLTANILEYDNGTEGVYHLVLSGNDAGSNYQISVNNSTTQVLGQSSGYKAFSESEFASTGTLITDLVQFTGTRADGDYISIKDDTNAEVGTLNITDSTDVNDLLSAINTSLTGTATATIDSGQIIVTNDADGTSYNLGLDYIATGTAALETADLSLPFTKAGTEAEANTKITDLAQFRGELAGGETITIDGTDNMGVNIPSVTLNVTATTTMDHLLDRINDAFEGVAEAKLEDGQIKLIDDTSGASSTSLTLTYDNAGNGSDLQLPTFDTTAGTVGGQHSNILDPASFTETQNAQDSMIKVDGYPTGETEWISRSSNTLKDILPGVTINLHGTTDTSDPANLETIDIGVSKDTKAIQKKLGSLVKAYNGLMSFIKENTKYNPETEKAGILISNSTVRTVRSIMRTPLATTATGFVDTVHDYLMPQDIGLEIDSDGVLSLDSEALEEAMDNGFNDVLSIIGADKTGTITNDAHKIISFYGASKYTTAGSYKVKVQTTTDGSNEIDQVWIRPEGETEWREADSWNDTSGVITFQAKESEDGDDLPERDLQIKLDMSTLTEGTEYTATVSVQQGFAGAISDALDKVLDSTDGYLTIARDNIKGSIENYSDRIEREEDRLNREKERLTQRFARLEAQLASIQQQMGALGMMGSGGGQMM